MVEILFNALNQNLVQFELKPGVEVIVYVTQLTLGEYGVKCITVIHLKLQRQLQENQSTSEHSQDGMCYWDM